VPARKRAAAKPRRPKRATRRPKRAARRPKTAARPQTAARRAPPAAGIGLTVQHMSYTSHSLDQVRHFYGDLLGFTDARFDPRSRFLFVPTGPSSSLGFSPPAEGAPDQWRPPREPSIYLIVRDVDRVYRALAERGVVFDQPPENTSWGHRVALLQDPEGRRVYLAQEGVR